MNLLPYPMAWIGPEPRSSYHNPEFLRLFKDADRYRDMAHWHFEHPLARSIIINWEDIADWWVGAGHLRVAQEPDDPSILLMLERNLEMLDFRARWDRQVIPHDPSSRRWIVCDLDAESEAVYDMQIWRHPFWPGAMLTATPIVAEA